MVNIRKCSECGKIFFCADSSQIFCSLICQLKRDPIDESNSKMSPGVEHNNNMLNNKSYYSTGKCLDSNQSKYFYIGSVLYQYK